MRLGPAVLFSTIAVVLAADGAWAAGVQFDGRLTVESDLLGAVSVVSADLDGDGDLDLLAPSPDGIIWWENELGSGTVWTEHFLDSSFAGAASVVAADLDGDGDLDVLGAASVGDEISWWENIAGDGLSWFRRPVANNFDGAVAAVAADMDGDGDLDVLGAAAVADRIVWWENTAGNGLTWTLHEVAIFDSPSSVVAADLDGDGDLDVLGGTSNIEGVNWWENTAGDGSDWTERVIIGVGGGISLVAADMDRDGDLDVLVAMISNNGIRWWENTAGDATAWLVHEVDTSNAVSVEAVDLDADGDLDVLGAGSVEWDVTWWENTAGDGTGWTEHTIDGEYLLARRVHATDVNGDGHPDVLATSTYSDPTHPDIVLYLNATIHRSAVYPTRRTIAAGPFDAASVFAADLDGDGDQDVLAVAADLAWWENGAEDGTVWTRHDIEDSSGARAVYAADMDGDGDLDVLAAQYDADRISWWENTAGDGTAWTRGTVGDNFDGASSVWAADIDGDGDQDVLGVSFFGDDVAWWENTGNGSGWDLHTLAANFDGAQAVAAADVDGDGDLDVLAAAFIANEVVWWENQGGGGTGWFPHVVDDGFASPRSVSFADVDGDGDVDVLGASGASEAGVVWWENAAGDGTFWTRHTLGHLVAGADAVLAADLDGDGDRDVLAAGAFGGDVVWWENGRTPCGAACSWPEHVVDGDFAIVRAIATVDVDRDGDLDVFGGALGEIAWWSNRGGQFALPTTDTAPPAIVNGQTAALLRIDARHRGWGSDFDVQLKTFELLFEEAPGDPLSTTEAGRLVRSLRIYLDDGSGTFDVADVLVTSVDSLALDAAGVQTVTFANGDPDVRVGAGPFAVPRTYFVVVEMTSSASTQTPDRFRLTHLTESSSTGEVFFYGFPLTLEFTGDVSSRTVVALAADDLIFADGFQ